MRWRSSASRATRGTLPKLEFKSKKSPPTGWAAGEACTPQGPTKLVSPRLRCGDAVGSAYDARNSLKILKQAHFRACCMKLPASGAC